MPSPCWRIESAGARLGKSILAGLWAAQGNVTTGWLGTCVVTIGDHLCWGWARSELSVLTWSLTSPSPVRMSWKFLDKTEVFGSRVSENGFEHGNWTSVTSVTSVTVPWLYGNFHEENDDSSIHQWKTGRFPMLFDRAIWKRPGFALLRLESPAARIFYAGPAMAMAANMLTRMGTAPQSNQVPVIFLRFLMMIPEWSLKSVIFFCTSLHLIATLGSHLGFRFDPRTSPKRDFTDEKIDDYFPKDFSPYGFSHISHISHG